MKIKLQTILVPLFYLGLFFVTNYFGGGINYSDLLFFSAGVFLGAILMDLDESILHKYYLEPHTKKIKLVTRSLVFMFSLVPLGIFIVTSTGSELGMGLFLGIITVLLFELALHRNNSSIFHARFMFQLKRKLSDQEIKYFTAVFSTLVLVFVMLTFFLGR